MTPAWRLGKVDAAVLQLDRACAMFYLPLDVDQIDLVSVYTLASASHEILEDLARRMDPRPKSLHKNIDAITDRTERKAIRDRVRRPQNFLKHADNDPDDQLVLTYEMVERKLALAVWLANDAFRMTRIMHGVAARLFPDFGKLAAGSPDRYVVFRRKGVPVEADRAFIRDVAAGKRLQYCMTPPSELFAAEETKAEPEKTS